MTIVKAVKVAIAVIPMIRNNPIARPDWCNAHGKATTDVPIIVFHMANLKKNMKLNYIMAIFGTVCQIVVRQSSGSCQAVVRQLSGNQRP